MQLSPLSANKAGAGLGPAGEQIFDTSVAPTLWRVAGLNWSAAFKVSVTLLARAAEIHDEETGNHILRVNEYSYAIAKRLGLDNDWCDELRYSAQLHDVGKMSVDAAVLKKKGPLTLEEREEMNRHTEYGYQILTAST